mmetsp:Transcript_55790/g.120566  ORF Transcript_55790/g.120566 Transcript_55790/m.120566 type:complete len:1014 (+) Transcript_55790:56-3097(+)
MLRLPGAPCVLRVTRRGAATLVTRGLVRVVEPGSHSRPLAAVRLRNSQRALFWGGRDSGSAAGGSGSSSGSQGNGDGKNGKSDDPQNREPAAAASDSAASTANTGGAASSEDTAIVPVSSQGIRKDTGPPFEPRLLALPLSRRPLFPGQQQLLHVTNPDVLKELSRLQEKGPMQIVGAFVRRSEEGAADARGDGYGQQEGEDIVGDPMEALHLVGTRARILHMAQFGRFSVEGVQMLLVGIDLIRLEKVLKVGPPLQVEVSKVQHVFEDSDSLKAHINETMHTIREIMKINPQFREHASVVNQGLERLERGDAAAIAHFAASLTTATGEELMAVLEAEQPLEKLRVALHLLKKELELSQLQAKIASQIEQKVSSTQREYMLREQLKAIKKELGEDKSDGTDALLEKFIGRLENKTVPKEAQSAIDHEIEKFRGLAKESQEYQTTRNYLDWLTELPWGVYSSEALSLQRAKTVLDRDHYGLADVKERILELIAVGKLRGTVQGKIICFVGPPGVGKTSIGRSIAEALGREFHRFSVGGLYDVAEIKGHRRTYVGAMPGKVIQCLKKTQTSNPLVLIDEVDKIGRGHQGDPASALLELLDPSQNYSFLDHYLDVPVDCSRVLFICTANVTDTIPGPLLDRMEVIRLSGYDLKEKIHIAQGYLVPSAMRECGLWPKESKDKASSASEDASEAATSSASSTTSSAEEDREKEAASLLPLPAQAKDAKITSEALEVLIRSYCREAGVRNLEKHIEKICRKLARKVVEHSENEAKEAKEDEASESSKKPSELVLQVKDSNLSDFVGKPVFISDRLYEGQLPPGTVTGLAWTAMGGSVLYIEATALPRPEGKSASPTLGVTGQLGSVMKESSQLAMLVARRQAATRAPDRANFFQEHDLHLHCPEGAVPKDGPSAGVTMVTSLLSLCLGRPVRQDLAMTGEVSLNGKVLAVGGIKEKTIAARRAGCRALVFPQANRRDFDELPDYLREGLEVHFAAEYDDVFAVAFSEAGAETPKEASSA